MITRLQFAVSLPDGAQADASWGYWLYSALLEQMPAEAAEWFHEQSFTPLSQYWLVDKFAHRACWRVSLLGDEAESLLLAPLEALSRLNLRECTQPLAVSLEGRERYASLSEFWNRAAAMPDVPSHQLRIWTPASFKSGGRYAIFPEARLILQNLVLRWNAIAPQCAISDEDALRMLEEKISIRDYRLQTSRFLLKEQRIPGFSGQIWLQNRLPAPLMEIWKLLLLFADFAGIGIKTALGMGGATLVQKNVVQA